MTEGHVVEGPSMANMAPAGITLSHPPSLVKPYLFRSSCLFGPFLKPDSSLRLTPEVQLSEFPIWLHRLTCPIRTCQLVLAHPNTDLPPFSLLQGPCLGICQIWIQPPCLSVLLNKGPLCWKLVFGCGLHLVQCPERCTPSVVPVIDHLKQANPI